MAATAFMLPEVSPTQPAEHLREVATASVSPISEEVLSPNLLAAARIVGEKAVFDALFSVLYAGQRLTIELNKPLDERKKDFISFLHAERLVELWSLDVSELPPWPAIEPEAQLVSTIVL